ncbi:hypothetical protein BGW38_006260 [Lunasporangiospora selenospora]|uniref:BHLH domain-containing protein n=1 Tax=Lunasporangiospora selenospora TaxID=979761 RepID=A0A9P6KAV2_9FUNG|nr:hypothetical protein BGW38_006260 [Lunasporangiospora selenospora]
MHKATSFTACSSAGRRLAHILSEQKRREKINGGFDKLLFKCAQNTDSKATILRKAVDYILLLEDEIRKYADAYPDFHRTGPGVGNAGTAGTSTGADVITIEDDSILARS